MSQCLHCYTYPEVWIGDCYTCACGREQEFPPDEEDWEEEEGNWEEEEDDLDADSNH
jgi:hypothetical protein